MKIFLNLRRIFIALSLLTMARAADTPVITPTLAKPSTAQPAANGLEQFRLIMRKNIFDPNRIGLADDAPPRGDSIALVGTILSDKSVVAFFESPDPQYRKVLHEGESVAQFTVKHIGADSVELLRDKIPLTLKIADQLHRPLGGDWAVEPMDRTAPAAAIASPVGFDRHRVRPAEGQIAPADLNGSFNSRRRGRGTQRSTTTAEPASSLDFLFSPNFVEPSTESAPLSEPSPNP